MKALVNLAYTQVGNSLILLSINDFSDGVINDGVMIQDFFLAGNNVIELLGAADNYLYDLIFFVMAYFVIQI